MQVGWIRLMRAPAALVLIAGCSASDSPVRSAAVVRDSAGIRIVENSAPAWNAQDRWTLDSLPSLTIGVEEGDLQREFFRLTDARQLADGRYVIANGASSELRYFGEDGEYLCTSGRQGAGPGEFEQLSWLQLLAGDTLLVYSSGGGGRLSLIDPHGKFVRTLEIPRITTEQFPTAVGMLPNGALLVRSARSYGLGTASGTYRDSAIFVVAHPGGPQVAKLGPLPTNERVVVGSGNSLSITSVLFGKYTVTGFGPNGFMLGLNDGYEIAHYDTAGRLTRLLRLDRAPEPVTSSAIAHVESARLANSGSVAERAMNESFFENMRFPPTMPSYSGMLVDADENLWVSRYAYLPGPRTWDVFDASGHLLGEVRMPRYFFPRQITNSEIIGSSRDAMEIERVKVYRIRKGVGDRGAGSSAATGVNEAEVIPSRYRACTGEDEATDRST